MHLVFYVKLANIGLELLDIGLALLEEEQVELFHVALRGYHPVPVLMALGASKLYIFIQK